MNLTKRQLLRTSALGIGVALLTIPCSGTMHEANAFTQSPPIPLFQTTLRGAGPGGIPVAVPGPTPAAVTGVTHYDINIAQFADQITPAGIGLGPTTIWGYVPFKGLGGYIKPTHLGGIIIGKGRNPNDINDKNQPIQITFHNKLLVNKPIVPVDVTMQDANKAINKTAIHLHGGAIPWISDGGPFDYFTPTGTHGLSFLNNAVLNPTAPRDSAEYYYPLNQSARFLWYHDHAHGITRTNAYSGLATALLVRDNYEAGLVANSGLPGYIENGGLELPLVFQDKIFVGKDIATQDPTWSTSVSPVATRPGSLWYAHVYEQNNLATGAGRWDWGGGLTPPNPSVVPEFFGDTMLVNGTTYPNAQVEARRYRLRMLNACNARFLNLQLYIANGTPDGITLNTSGVPTNVPFVNAATQDSSWLQIGAEGGFLSKPAKVPSNTPFLITDPNFLTPPGLSLDPSQINKSLVVAPAERADLIVDFSGYAPGTQIILYNDAPSPFPSGDDRNDYFPGWNVGNGAFGITNPTNGITKPGNGPNTRVLMRFTVKAATATDSALTINTATDLTPGIDPALNPWGSITVPKADAQGLPIPVRKITLNEYFDDYGRLVQLIGSDPTLLGGALNSQYGTPYDGSALYLGYPGAPVPDTGVTVGATSEDVQNGKTEVWEVYNTTGDVHPMHIHLVNAQVINREVFDPLSPYPFTLSGTPIAPSANELGWKETIMMFPGTVTRLLMKWDLAPAAIVDSSLTPITTTAGAFSISLGQPPVSPRTGTMEYVWHCHILEHEEHDMMHTINVTP